MTCTRGCEHGMCQVSDAYAVKLTPKMSELAAQLAGMLVNGSAPTTGQPAIDYDLTYRAWQHEHQRRAALTNSWFPCPECQPKGFARWRNGCWDTNHDSARCDVCGTGKARR